MAAMRQERQGIGILTGQLAELRPAGGIGQERPHDVGGRVLHAHDVGQARQTAHGLGRHVDHGAAGDVVDDQGQLDRVMDRPKVGVETLLRRLVVVGGHHQGRVGARPLGVPGQADRLFGRVRAGPGDHRHPTAGGLDAQLDHPLMLGVAHGRALPGGPDWHEALGTLGEVPCHQLLECPLVERPVAKRRHERDNRAMEHVVRPSRL